MFQAETNQSWFRPLPVQFKLFQYIFQWLSAFSWVIRGARISEACQFGLVMHSIHIALLWSAGFTLSPFYRHIAPLERKTKDLLDGRGAPAPTRKPMDFQRLTCVNVSTCRPSGALGLVLPYLLYTYRPAGALGRRLSLTTKMLIPCCVVLQPFSIQSKPRQHLLALSAFSRVIRASVRSARISETGRCSTLSPTSTNWEGLRL